MLWLLAVVAYMAVAAAGHFAFMFDEYGWRWSPSLVRHDFRSIAYTHGRRYALLVHVWMPLLWPLVVVALLLPEPKTAAGWNIPFLSKWVDAEDPKPQGER